MSSSRIPTTAVLGVIMFLFLGHVAYLWCPTEDGFISFRFARNLAQGYGFVWNPGEAPVEGFTNLLLVLLGALTLKLGAGLEWVVPLLTVGSSLLVMGLCYRLGRRHLGLSERLALVAPLLLAVSGPFATWASSGLETNLFALLVLAAVGLGARAVEPGRSAEPRWAYACAAASFLGLATRMEGGLVFALLVGVAWLRMSWAEFRRAGFVGATVLFAALVLGLTCWRVQTFGYPLPNTFYAKTGGGLAQARRGVVYAVFFTAFYVLPLVPALVLWWRRGVVDGKARTPFLLIVCGVIPAVYECYIVAVGGDYMAMFRFYVPILPLAYLGFAGLLGMLPESFAARGVGRLALGLAVLGTLVHSTPLEARIMPAVPRNHGTWRGVELERWHTARLTVIGELLEGIKGSSDESVFTNAIGALGYHARMRVIGQHGLVDAALAHRDAPALGGDLGQGLPGHERFDLEYSLGLEPTYWLFDRELTAEPRRLEAARLPGYSEALIAALEREYEVRSEWIDDTLNGESGYFSFLQRR
ncbi:MAG: arabinofuranosyltransferase [Planctomycetota bacterium]|jgi:arabinofuranosyltransferase